MFYSISQYPTPFHWWIVFCFMNITHFVYLFISWLVLGFSLLTTMNNAAIYIYVHKKGYCMNMFSFLSGRYLRVELLGHMVTLFVCLSLNTTWIFENGMTQSSTLKILTQPQSIRWIKVGRGRRAWKDKVRHWSN